MSGINNENLISGRDCPKRKLGLYIHIPFCVRKCNYCDFLSGPYDEETKKKYFEALLAEIRSYEGRTEEYEVASVFIGGGTPSSVEASYIVKILETIREVFKMDINGSKAGSVVSDMYTADITKNDNTCGTGTLPDIELTIEVNPGTVSRDKLAAYKETGINRLSFGLQSADNKELKLLGRIHTYEEFEKNYYMARELGFNNINIDLMSALPGQTVKAWEDTLLTAVKLTPEHISAYSLIIEEGTPFFDSYREGAACHNLLPDEETDRLIYKRTREILEEYGYNRYEISNYSRKGYECTHNLAYWTGRDYLGLGLGSSSLIKNVRFHNTSDINEYISLCTLYCNNKNNAQIRNKVNANSDILEDYPGIRREINKLSVSDRMEEFMFLGLRITEGVSRKEFFKSFGIPIDKVYGDVIGSLSDKGLLMVREDNIALTDYGIDVSNVALAEFLL